MYVSAICRASRIFGATGGKKTSSRSECGWRFIGKRKRNEKVFSNYPTIPWAALTSLSTLTDPDSPASIKLCSIRVAPYSAHVFGKEIKDSQSFYMLREEIKLICTFCLDTYGGEGSGPFSLAPHLVLW